jgi:hypothetical protein
MIIPAFSQIGYGIFLIHTGFILNKSTSQKPAVPIISDNQQAIFGWLL